MAREAKLAWDRAYHRLVRARLVAAGMCPRCREAEATTHTHCFKCRVALAKAQRVRDRRRARQRSLCACGRIRRVSGRSDQCAKCASKQREINRYLREGKREGRA